VRRLEAQQAAQSKAHRLEMEAVQVQRAAEEQRMRDMFSFMSSLQALPGVVVPESLLAPIVAPPPPIGTPVSMYSWLFTPLACAALVHILMNSLLFGAASVGGFEPESLWWPFATGRVANWPFTARALRSTFWVARMAVGIRRFSFHVR
jgi:hypothetical protein